MKLRRVDRVSEEKKISRGREGGGGERGKECGEGEWKLGERWNNEN